MKNRVVVTGMGALCALGNDPAQIWQGIEANVCGIAPIESFDTTDFKVKLAAEIKDLDMSQWLDKRQQRFNDRYALFARIAAKQA
ncbi:MAG: beta-ketoacyl-[acyl-carrier-protein] synthase II, partial [Ileibacterium sp.]|nr:beta-ketoacyl-[acyl-carrier-protein] synthase II [Ileibacterium sp.]